MIDAVVDMYVDSLDPTPFRLRSLYVVDAVLEMYVDSLDPSPFRLRSLCVIDAVLDMYVDSINPEWFPLARSTASVQIEIHRFNPFQSSNPSGPHMLTPSTDSAVNGNLQLLEMYVGLID